MNEFLKNVGSKLKTQDNLCTSDPIFMVQERKRIYGMDEAYSENYKWIDCPNDYCEADEELTKKLDVWDDTNEIPEEYSEFEKVYYQDFWINIMPFFTMDAAQNYIDRYGYRLKNPRVYVDCAYRNPEWIEVRKFLMGLE